MSPALLQSVESVEELGALRLSLRPLQYAQRVQRRALEAQNRRDEISGINRTHYCGAYWGYGFHEDGVVSGLAVARHFGQDL